MGLVSRVNKEGHALLTAIRAMGLPACDLIDINVSLQVMCTTCQQRWDKGYQTPFRCPKYKEIQHDAS